MIHDTRPGAFVVQKCIDRYSGYADELRALGERTFGAGLEPTEDDLKEFARIGTLLEGAARSVQIIAHKYGIELNVGRRGAALVPPVNDLDQYKVKPN